MSIPISVRSISMNRVYAWREGLSIFLALTKIRISLLATLTTATGYLLATGKITIHMLAPSAAVFLLACGSCASINTKKGKSPRMERTKSRPIPGS
jgi:heme O synthase-like polyprenyltransferase